MELALILGARCNASCDHCSKSYGPRRRETLDRESVLRLMDEAAAIDDGTPLMFSFTGGEPFLDFDLLIEVIAHGQRLAAEVSCITNAYWAHTDQKATEKLTALREVGLTKLGVSVSRFHQRYVPLARVRRALAIARHLGIRTELKGAVINSDLAPDGVLAEWRSTLEADSVHIFPVLPCLREGASLPEQELYRVPGLPTEPCPQAFVTIATDGRAMSCCSPGAPDDFLALGHVRDVSLAVIEKRFRESGKQRALRERGPAYFAAAAIAQGEGSRLRDAYAGPCDLCWHIRSDPALSRIAEQVSTNFE